MHRGYWFLINILLNHAKPKAHKHESQSNDLIAKSRTAEAIRQVFVFSAFLGNRYRIISRIVSVFCILLDKHGTNSTGFGLTGLGRGDLKPAGCSNERLNSLNMVNTRRRKIRDQYEILRRKMYRV